MKKLFAALLGVLMLSLVLTGIALADPVTQDDITFEVNVDPLEMLPPAAGTTEEIIVTVVITNNTPNPLTDIQLFIRNAEDPNGTLAEIPAYGSDATGEIVVRMNISASDIGVDIPFNVDYTTAGESHTYNGTFRVEEIQSQTSATISAVAVVNGERNATMGPDGASVYFEYTIHNNGNVNITSISISENMTVGGSSTNTAILHGDISAQNPLEPDETVTITGHTANLSGDIRVSPVLLYNSSYDSGESQASAVTVTKYAPQLEFTLTVANTNVTYGSSTKLYFNVTNTGNVTLNNIRVLNESNREVRNVSSLTPGNSISGEVSITVTSTRSYRYSVSAQSPDGQSVSANESVTVNMVPLEPTDIQLGLTVSADKVQLDSPGTVTITIEITNRNAFELNDIQIMDSRDQLITTISSLLSDATETIEHTMELSYSEEIFVCAYVPVEGNSEPSEIVSNMISVEVSGGADATPTASPSPTSSLSPTATGSLSPSASGETPQEGLGLIDILIIGFVVILVLVAIAIAALVTINVLDKKKKAKNRQMNRKIK